VTPAATAVVDALVWAVWSTAVGYGFHRQPASRFASDNALTHLRRWERSGRIYESVGVRRWKDKVPEAGALLPGGISKRRLGGRSLEDLQRFAAETRRAELVHWTILAIAPLFAIWSSWPLFAAMVAYAVVANLPCIVIQRYNRARIARATARRRRGVLR